MTANRDSFRSNITVPQQIEMAVRIDLNVLKSIEIALGLI